VKSNSSRATKSIAADACSEGPGCTATFAPTRPTVSDGLAALSASATFTSPGNVGELVCSTASSYSRAGRTTSSRDRPAGWASTSVLPGTIAAGCASQVGYQYDRISRLAWYRAPAPPSKPAYDGGLRKSVRIIWVRLLSRRLQC
jgi:hypothetical protein